MFYLVKKQGSGHSAKVEHENLDEAYGEANRLAKLDPGEKFFVMKPVACIEAKIHAYEIPIHGREIVQKQVVEKEK